MKFKMTQYKHRQGSEKTAYSICIDEFSMKIFIQKYQVAQLAGFAGLKCDPKYCCSNHWENEYDKNMTTHTDEKKWN